MLRQHKKPEVTEDYARGAQDQNPETWIQEAYKNPKMYDEN
jgi:hypothetical protein